MNREERRRNRNKDYAIIDIEVTSLNAFPVAHNPSGVIDSVFVHKPGYNKERMYTIDKNHPYKSDAYRRMIDVIDCPSEQCMLHMLRETLVDCDLYQYSEFDINYLSARMSLLTGKGLHETINSSIELIDIVKSTCRKDSYALSDILNDGDGSTIPFEVRKLRYLSRITSTYLCMLTKQNIE